MSYKKENLENTVSEHEVLSSKKITNDASYSFYVLGSAYDKITVTKRIWLVHLQRHRV